VDTEFEYLCGIGIDKVEKHEVGMSSNGNVFYFRNGAYGRTALYKNGTKDASGNCTRVLTARRIK
jgi:hypothetical protein